MNSLLRLVSSLSLLAAISVVPGVDRHVSAQSSFRARTELVVLQVTVTNGRLGYVSDLGQGDFAVFEDGQTQELTHFSHDRKPLAVSLLLDTSTSMEKTLGLAQEAAVQFVRQLQPNDLAELVTFNEHVSVPQPFTNAFANVEAAIRTTRAAGSTSLYTAVYIALTELQSLPRPTTDLRRHALVLLSDGDDTSSLVRFDQALEQARHSSVAIYAIGLYDGNKPSNAGFDEGKFVLRQLAESTGGRAIFADRATALAGVYAQIAEELATQYTLAYVPRAPGRNAATWRTVTVRVKRPDCAARTRPGYFAG